MESGQIILGYMLNGIQEDVLKLPNDPIMPQKWAIIQRLFIIMIKVYNMGKHKELLWNNGYLNIGYK